MTSSFTLSDTINTLVAVFEKHKTERVCVISTTCCGKSTILREIPYCVDMDEIAFLNITEEEAAFINQTPWTKEIGEKVDELTYKNARIQPGSPMFGTVIVDCDVVVYLDISDELLENHCKKRGVNYLDAKNMQKAINEDWNNHKLKKGKVFYYTAMAE